MGRLEDSLSEPMMEKYVYDTLQKIHSQIGQETEKTKAAKQAVINLHVQRATAGNDKELRRTAKRICNVVGAGIV